MTEARKTGKVLLKKVTNSFPNLNPARQKLEKEKGRKGDRKGWAYRVRLVNPSTVGIHVFQPYRQ